MSRRIYRSGPGRGYSRFRPPRRLIYPIAGRKSIAAFRGPLNRGGRLYFQRRTLPSPLINSGNGYSAADVGKGRSDGSGGNVLEIPPLLRCASVRNSGNSGIVWL